jgi:hypothetical protein
MKPFVGSVDAVMDRRILVNYRVRPEVLQRLVPRPFRVQEVGGWGLAGICLIRLRALRPAGLPAWMGLASENAAHRVAVEWDEGGVKRSGVYILRRDTDSRVNEWAGGRLFPGVHGRARFRAVETAEGYTLAMETADGRAGVRVDVVHAAGWPAGSVWGSVDEASAFFRGGCCGWSATADGGGFEGAELEPEGWVMTPLRVREAWSGLYSDGALFPAGTIELDSAVLMRGIAHTWRNRGVRGVGVGAWAGGGRVRGAHGPSAMFRFP